MSKIWITSFEPKPSQWLKGIGKENLEHIFEPFFTTKTMGKGTGLGLSMVFGFIQRSKGHIKIDSVSETGTTVKCYLPHSINQNEELITPGPIDSKLPRGQETILVVDDEEELLSLAQQYLEELGYTVITTTTGAQALEILALKSDSIDRLFSDVVMPGGINGYELAEQACAR